MCVQKRRFLNVDPSLIHICYVFIFLCPAECVYAVTHGNRCDGTKVLVVE